jgi:hypothetical protein
MDLTWERPKKARTIIHGYRSDLERVKMLDASLQLQCQSALNAWINEQGPDWQVKSKMQKFKDRRQFIDAFASAILIKLRRARRTAVQETAQEQAAASNGSESVDDAKAGVELVLRDRAESVKDWFDTKYGNNLRTVRYRPTSGSASAYAAGHEAGRNADTGATRVSGGRRAIGS